jgi:benzoyl-CoA-dihydrodiol lyase
MARELDDAILHMRSNETAIGIWLLRTEGDAAPVTAVDDTMATHADHWFVRETRGMLRRTLARLDVSSRTLFALIETGSCFAGTLLELALAADRSYMLDTPDNPTGTPRITPTEANFGWYPMIHGKSRIARRFHDEREPIEAVHAIAGQPLEASEAQTLGLVTMTPDTLDWDDEIRMAIEERASLSPDALTGLEANLRFGEGETMETRVFGRLSAWQNWIFIRPNAVGEQGALKVYGKGEKTAFDWNRV